MERLLTPIKAQITGIGKVLMLDSGLELKVNTKGFKWGDKVEIFMNWHTRQVAKIQSPHYYDPYENI